jgi:methylthioribose-1-phosphate isomerase
MIEQTLLPEKYKVITVRTPKEMWHAIKRLAVRGAPAIGIAGAYGAFLGIQKSKAKTWPAFKKELLKVTGYLAKSRPTAVNLFWALDRMVDCAEQNKDKPVKEIIKALKLEADAIYKEDQEICRKIGKNGAKLVKKHNTILTHCNAGGLATADYGTALAVMYAAQEMGKKISVFADETRPLLQGARLTTWELKKAGIPVTLICDNMAAQVMKEGRIDMVVVGADRIAGNGDAANKIGTYGVALLAKAHKIPFYIAAPKSTFDFTLKSGDGIPIEQRKAEEVSCGFGKRTAPKGVSVYNPAFDVTPARLISGIITEYGVIEKPNKTKIKSHFGM